MAVPAGPVAVAAVLRPGEPRDALPRHPVDLQCLPGQGQLHDVVLRARGSARGRRWPASEAARFHRGIACAVGVLGLVWPLGTALTGPGPDSLLVLAVAVVVALLLSVPLWSHLRRTAVFIPEGMVLPARSTTQSPSGRRPRRPRFAGARATDPTDVNPGRRPHGDHRDRHHPGAAGPGRSLAARAKGVRARRGVPAGTVAGAAGPGRPACSCRASTSWSGWTCGWSR